MDHLNLLDLKVAHFITLFFILGHHYGGWGACNNIHISIQLIEEVKHTNMEFLAQQETFWQHQLRVYVENGGKAHCYRKDL